MSEEWDKLTEAELAALREAFQAGEEMRQAFVAWEAKRAKLRMTAGERQAHYRRYRTRLPWM